MKENITININGVPFEQHPDIGWSSSEGKDSTYRFNYIKIARAIAAEEKCKRGDPKLGVSMYRELIKNDLFFLLYFIVKPFTDEASRAMVNHPFVVQACREVELGPKDFTLDVWARFHYKSSIITTAETIQYQLNNPEHATGIFSFKSSVAKDFLFSIKETFQRERILHDCFADVVWSNCEKEASLWSIDEGIVLKRKTNRREASISAHGLIEGMPTGLHFERRVYDDIVTKDLVKTVDMMEDVKEAYDTSQNLKTLTGGHHRVLGTYYHHNDPLIYVRDKKDLEGNSRYTYRHKPATHDGTANGVPVLMTQESLDELKGDTSFNAQQLLNPTPDSEIALNPDFLREVEHKLIPRGFKFMIIDQAGDEESSNSKYRKSDPWAMGIFRVEPKRDKEIGQCRVFIEDLWIETANESEAIDQAVRMYLKAGVVQKLGVEKVGMTTTHIHIANALKARGRHVTFGELKDRGKTGVLLRPSGRNKRKFIEAALSWPLNNSMWYYSKECPTPPIERLKMEMKNFPYWHDDALNICAYLYDIIQNYNFSMEDQNQWNRPLKMAACPV